MRGGLRACWCPLLLVLVAGVALAAAPAAVGAQEPAGYRSVAEVEA